MTLASSAPTAEVPLNPNWCTKIIRATAETKRMIISADVGVDSEHISRSSKLKYWKLKRLNSKVHFPFEFSAARPRLTRPRILIIAHFSQFVKRKMIKKNNYFFSQKGLTNQHPCAIIRVQRKRERYTL